MAPALGTRGVQGHLGGGRSHATGRFRRLALTALKPPVNPLAGSARPLRGGEARPVA